MIVIIDTRAPNSGTCFKTILITCENIRRRKIWEEP